jgi:hypothetical protein
MRANARLILCLGLLFSLPCFAQQQQAMPPDYNAVLTSLGKQGDFKDGVLKVNIPRNDLKVVVDVFQPDTRLVFGGLDRADQWNGYGRMMGDLVLTEEEQPRHVCRPRRPDST